MTNREPSVGSLASNFNIHLEYGYDNYERGHSMTQPLKLNRLLWYKIHVDFHGKFKDTRLNSHACIHLD